MKRFIAYVCQQQNYDAYEYKINDDCPKSFAYSETRLPILPVMNGVSEDGETVQVILIATDHKAPPDADPEPVYRRNLRWTIEEMDGWATKHHITIQYKIIEYQSLRNVQDAFDLFERLIGVINEGTKPDDVFYADMTFGMRTMTIVLLYALQYAKAIKKASVGNIIYGQLEWSDGKRSELHEVTALFYMNSIIAHVEALNLERPEDMIRMMFDEFGDRGMC